MAAFVEGPAPTVDTSDLATTQVSTMAAFGLVKVSALLITVRIRILPARITHRPRTTHRGGGSLARNLRESVVKRVPMDTLMVVMAARVTLARM